MEVRLTVNPYAGKGNGRKVGRKINQLAIKMGLVWRNVGYRYRVLVGGDGTLHRAINEPRETDIPWIICSAGIGNDFARALGIPEDPEKALRLSLLGKPREVDLIEVNGELATGVASFGFDAKVNQRALWLKKKYWFLPVKLMYRVALLWESFFHWECFQVEVETQGTVLRERVVMVAVANISPYGRIFNIAPGADPSDGLLDVCVIRQASRWRVLKNLFRVIRGTHIALPETQMFKTTSLSIRSKHPLPCQMDGEVISAKREYKISVQQRALKVLAP
ncbi:MAG: diacylglycerol kinase family lipid kinase [bacterium]|nr:diacylglycerol kinase family lipid kinase [bacterium]